MFQKLVNHNEDIAKLVKTGFAVSIVNNHLVVRDIPYLDHEGNLKFGAIISPFTMIDENHVSQNDHQIWFAGSHPCQLDGSLIANLGGGAAQLNLGENCQDIVVERSFSNKPRLPDGSMVGYVDFFAKIDSYTNVISGPAIERYGVSPYTHKFNTISSEEIVFKYPDTLSSRAGILEFSNKFRNEVVGIIGLGGTGSYLLDFLVKMPIKEIRGFDPDIFHIHNAYRSPGKVENSEFGKSKADVYDSRYQNFRNGLIIKPTFIDETSAEDIRGLSFAFVCVDKGSSRAKIFQLLISEGVPFIDVGIGINKKEDGLAGMARVTYYPPDKANDMLKLNLAETSDRPEDLYRSNIQIAELNAINASLAVLKYKQVKGFYIEEKPNLHILFNLEDIKIASEDQFDGD